MNRLASPAQLRASLLRWSLFLVPTVLLLGFLSAQMGGSMAENAWFQALDKPGLFPQPTTYAIVWSILYVMMGVALAMVCSAWGARWRPYAILAFVLQFSLNLAWSPIFFTQHDLALALAVIIALDAALIGTVYLFWKVRRAAAYLMLPYLVWCLFASLLNWQFLELNRDAGDAEPTNAVQRFEL